MIDTMDSPLQYDDADLAILEKYHNEDISWIPIGRSKECEAKEEYQKK